MSTNPKTKTASLDRIDSLKGYTLDNVQWIHKDLNYMKCDYEENEYIEWCKKVAAFQAAKNLNNNKVV